MGHVPRKFIYLLLFMNRLIKDCGCCIVMMAIHWKDLDTVLLKPDVGNQKVMRDPSIVQGPDGIFHLVWTSSWRGDKGFGYASSKDLIHWSEQQFIPVMEHEPTTVNVWAPELFYDDEGKQFIIIWASCIPGDLKEE